MTLPAVGFGTLIAAIIVVATLLMVMLLTTRLAWRLKLVCILLGAAAQLAAYFAFPPLLGWPATEPLPRKFSLIAVNIQEPSLFVRSPGEVTFWVIDITHAGAPRPRAYRLPFSPELKAKAAEAAGKLRKNIPQTGEMSDEDELGLSGTPRDESEAGTLKSHRMQLRFVDATPGGPPAKSAEPAPGASPPATP